MDPSEIYYERPAAAYLRSALDADPATEFAALVERGRAAGLRLQRFKRSSVLPRVRRVLGFLQAVRPTSLLDVGTGRGVFLWPLLDAFPELPVHCVDPLEHRVAMLAHVRDGGLAQLSVEQGDITDPDRERSPRDVVTILEVLEHLEHPRRAMERCVALAERHVAASVPSKEDENPEHIQLFRAGELAAGFLAAGARSAREDHVPNHRLVFVST